MIPDFGVQTLDIDWLATRELRETLNKTFSQAAMRFDKEPNPENRRRLVDAFHKLGALVLK